MKKVWKIAICVITLFVLLSVIGFIFKGNDKPVEDDIIEQPIESTIDNSVDDTEGKSTTEIPEAYIEDELNLEEQEVESEAFELQGEIAYNGTAEIPTVPVGKYNGLTYFSQIDSRWKDLHYTSTGNSKQTIGSSGCGPTCAAMVVSSIKGTISPVEMSKLYVDYGFRSANNGTYWSAFRFTADVFDIGYTETIYLDKACELLQDNYYLITACGNGLFTTGGHFIVLYDYDGTHIKVYDPYLYSGKFNTSTRRGKAIVDGNTVLVTKDNFRAYANYGTFFAFKNDRTDIKVDDKPVVIATYKRYVKVSTSLNIRSGAGTSYSRVGSLYNGNEVTVYEESGNWSRIGDGQWVCSDYLSDSNTTVKNTVGETRKLKTTTTLYSNSNLSGARYTYLPNTKVVIKQNVSNTVDKVYIPATGRIAYVCISAYTETSSSSTTPSLVGMVKKFKGNTTIYANSSMSGTSYAYLPNTSVKVLKDLGDIDYIYVTATGRYGYVYESVYK